jgi:chromosome segregation ATPase
VRIRERSLRIVPMVFRDSSTSLLERNAELSHEIEALKARIAELERALAEATQALKEDNTEAFLRRQAEALLEDNERLRADIKRLDPTRTTEDREREERRHSVKRFLGPA